MTIKTGIWDIEIRPILVNILLHTRLCIQPTTTILCLKERLYKFASVNLFIYSFEMNFVFFLAPGGKKTDRERKSFKLASKALTILFFFKILFFYEINT